jgi:hypothetical protein
MIKTSELEKYLRWKDVKHKITIHETWASS